MEAQAYPGITPIAEASPALKLNVEPQVRSEMRDICPLLAQVAATGTAQLQEVSR